MARWTNGQTDGTAISTLSVELMNECRCMINTAKQLYKQVTYHCCHQCLDFRWQHNAAEKDSTEQQQCVHHACAGRLFHCRQTTAAQAASVGAAAARHLQYRHNINQSLSHYCPLSSIWGVY